MSQILHVLDRGEGKEPRQILERFSVDAYEIVASDPDRFEILGVAPQALKGAGPGSTTAVLDNDTPSEVARKVLEAAGVAGPKDPNESDEIADQDVNGQPVNEAAADRRAGHGAKLRAKKSAEKHAAPKRAKAHKKTHAPKTAHADAE